MIDPDVMSGTPCFRDTRVPFKNLIDYLVVDDDGTHQESWQEVAPDPEITAVLPVKSVTGKSLAL